MKLAWALLAGTLLADASPPDVPATISGTVRVVDPPRRKKLRMDADPKAAAMHPGPVLSEDVAVDDHNRVKWAFVHIKSGLGDRKFPPPEGVALLRHEKALLVPRVVGVRTGQGLKIRNEDDLLHNSHGLTYVNPEFNFGQPVAGHEEVKKFDLPEVMILVKCDIHPWERAWLGVVEHPFFAVTGADGRFEIRDVPPGRYTIEVWQERYKPVTRDVLVRGRKSYVLDFALAEKKGD